MLIEEAGHERYAAPATVKAPRDVYALALGKLGLADVQQERFYSVLLSAQNEVSGSCW